jgi:hypothetical protein
MEKPTKDELIEDSHKKLASYYYDWSLLFYYYFIKLHKSANISRKDKRKLERNPKHSQELVKKLINEDFSFDHMGEYKEIKEDADSYFEAVFEKEFEAQMFVEDDNFKDFIKSIGKEKNAPIGLLMEQERGEKEGLDLDYGLSFLESAYEHRVLSIIYNNHDEFIKIMEKFVENGNVYCLIEEYREAVTRDGFGLIGYWASKIQPIKRSRTGSRARTKKKIDRTNRVKKGIEEKGTLTDRGIEIDREIFYTIFEEVFEVKQVSHPTISSYKKDIEAALSKEKGRKIEIIVKK